MVRSFFRVRDATIVKHHLSKPNGRIIAPQIRPRACLSALSLHKTESGVV